MAKTIIGGETIDVSLPSFYELKRAWAHLDAAMTAEDPMAGVDGILGVISVGSAGNPSVEELERRLTPREMPALRTFLLELIEEVGLSSARGEDTEAAASP